MITSPHNEKLKLIRRLGRRRSREREGLFIGEGEDLLAAARDAGVEPVELLTAAGEGLGGIEVEPALLARVSKLGSGTRAIGVWREAWAEEAVAPCVYLHGVSDPGNVGTVIRAARALVGGSVVLGPEREGLPEATLARCDVQVTIPLREGAESLNVAAAAAIALQRIASGSGEGHG